MNIFGEAVEKKWTILEILNWIKDYFKEKELENPRLSAERILSQVLDYSRFDLYVHFEENVSEKHRAEIKQFVLRRGKGEPLQYVLGETEFYGYRIFVTQDVLIPRPETEYLVEKIIKENRSLDSILELGTGSGCIAISLKNNFPKSAITAVDISDKALEIARKNAKENNIEINFQISDIFDSISEKFDLIVSNPPYIPIHEYIELPSEIINYEPKLALQAEDNGLYFYKEIISNAKSYLNPNGKLYLEIGYNQGDSIKEIAKSNGFSEIEIVKDLNGFERILKAILKS